MRPIQSGIRADLARIADRFDIANKRAWHATVAGAAGDKEAAEWERWQAAGDFFAASEELADLLLLLLRHAIDKRPNELAMYLTDALQDELRPLAAAVAQLQGGK